VELGFAITFHKIQGRTIPLLLLNLNNSGQKPHLTFEAAYVALTRVTHGDNVRIMGALNADLQFDHLLRLNADPDVQGWLGGFGPDGLWTKERAMSEASVLKIAVAAKKDAQHKARQRLYKAHFDESKAASSKDGKDETNRQQQEASSSAAPSGRKKPAAKVPPRKDSARSVSGTLATTANPGQPKNFGVAIQRTYIFTTKYNKTVQLHISSGDITHFTGDAIVNAALQTPAF